MGTDEQSVTGRGISQFAKEAKHYNPTVFSYHTQMHEQHTHIYTHTVSVGKSKVFRVFFPHICDY